MVPSQNEWGRVPVTSVTWPVWTEVVVFQQWLDEADYCRPLKVSRDTVRGKIRI